MRNVRALPIPGNVVHFSLHEGGEVLPAVVVRVLNPEGSVNLHVYTDGEHKAGLTYPVPAVKDVQFNEAGFPGTWHWPAHTDATIEQVKAAKA